MTDQEVQIKNSSFDESEVNPYKEGGILHAVLSDVEIYKPVCYLKWTGRGTSNISFSIGRDFNWFQKKMLKWCFGFEYEKVNE